MKYDKEYYESYALLIVSDLLGIDIENFDKYADRPDIQNKIDSIGIEVTRSITDHEGYIVALSNKHFGLGKSGKVIQEEILEINSLLEVVYQ